MPIVDNQARQEAKAAIIKRCNEGFSFAMVGAFAEFMEKYTRDTMRRYGRLDWEIAAIPFPPKSYDRLYRKLCDGSVRLGDQQTKARFRRKTDLCGLLCAAAAMFAAQCGSDKGLHPSSADAVRNRCIFNEDGLACVVMDQFIKTKLRVASESSK